MKLLALAASAAMLSSCVSMNPAIPVPASADLARICRMEPVVHAAFVALAPQAGVPPRVIAAERSAHVAVRTICANPPDDAVTALAVAADAYAAVVVARDEVEERI